MPRLRSREKKHVITLAIPSDLKAQLERAAVAEDLSQSAVVRRALRAFLMPASISNTHAPTEAA